MTDSLEQTEKKKRFRSPAYPALDLAKAIERTTSLMKTAHHHSVGISVVLQAWGMDSDAGPVWRYLAALIQYGLITDSGTGKARKFQITDIARRIIQDQAPNSLKRKEALKSAALSPTIHKALWDQFGSATDLSDAVLKSYLTLDRTEAGDAPYSESAAAEVIQTYKSALVYAGLENSENATDVEVDKAEVKNDESSYKSSKQIAIGNYVQWTSNGVDQFSSARRVEAVFEGHAQVFGSNVGIPIAELTLANPPAPPSPGGSTQGIGGECSQNEFNVLQKGNRLQITADVDLEGIRELKEMLGDYESILTRLAGRRAK